MSDQVFANLNTRARVILCGLVSSYTGGDAQTYKNYSSILFTRTRVEGFIVGMDDRTLLEKGSKYIAEHLKNGDFKLVNTKVSFKDAPKSFAKLFSENDNKKGKLLVRF